MKKVMNHAVCKRTEVSWIADTVHRIIPMIPEVRETINWFKKLWNVEVFTGLDTRIMVFVLDGSPRLLRNVGTYPTDYTNEHFKCCVS
jgi:hypothetical protein